MFFKKNGGTEKKEQEKYIHIVPEKKNENKKDDKEKKSFGNIIIGLIIGAIVLVIFKFFSKKSVGALNATPFAKEEVVYHNAKEVDCLEYYDLKELLYDSQIASYLKKHPNHGLIARKKNITHNGKNMIYMKTYYYDIQAKKDIEMDNPLILISEKMNDELEERFGPADIIFVEKTFY